MIDYSKLLYEFRIQQQMSQEDFAKELGMSFTTINRWEKGHATPRNSILQKIRERYQMFSELEKKFNKDKFNVYALFAGAGGFHLGIEQSDFEVLVASDIEPVAAKTHEVNWPNTPFINKDIRELSSYELLEAANGVKPDLIIGGPPCQGFSTLGAKISADPRNELFDHYARIVSDLQPKAFLFENVKSMGTLYKGAFKDKVIQRFSALGYRIYEKVINVAEYGVPQFRERLFLFGTKEESNFAFPKKTHGDSLGLLPYTTTGSAINDLVNKDESYMQGHIALNHSDTVIERYKYIPEGGRLPPPEELPEAIRRKNFGNTYKRLHRDKPALTMVPGNNAFPVHPTLHRSLTPREAARIQTFPDSHIFSGDRRRQCILVGNAVPPLMAKNLANSISEHFKGKTEKDDTSCLAEVKQALPQCEKPKNILSKYGYRPDKATAEDSFVDLFCGAGGFTIGFTRAGWSPAICVDFNKNVALTHEQNYVGTPFIQGDLSDAALMEDICSRFERSSVGIVVGGPPCQGFSIFGKRRFVNTKGYDPHIDPRNKLVYSYVDAIKRLNPRWFVMENVAGLLTLDNGFFIDSLMDEFKALGYTNVEYKVLNAADYGVPQLRKRLIIIGNRTGHVIPWPKKKFFKEPKDWQKPYRTTGEVINDLAEDESYAAQFNHVPMKHKPLLVERYSYIEEGEKLNVDKLPEHLKSGYRTDKVKNYSHIFKRIHRQKPAPTMVPGHNAFPIHPHLNRALTVREAARIQTFPDDIEFKGSRQEQCIQVGNAFPPLLAELIAGNIKKAETNQWYPDNLPKSASYALVDVTSAEEKDEKEAVPEL
ncbi:DNA (cytosine-5-)-methyltransferase [Colwellia sp. 1_MG-2023]|uniref:DNA (cytosine-5-)-methyltransferase n=1 Tax=Colwellia sp. 1_MG-2023 TaxID=3062649 RepID=UPI0026E1BF76|nr:DNA (cytosine-5-)-methyltransferase [Colwellia sp. 1_MG-2023]MDO6447159.1 DNA (cytosine-5-)-methyltransferase [Colwellia sp. 1_MG-2023]